MAHRKRKVVLGCALSLDGYIARPDGSVDFLEIGMDPADLEQFMRDFYKNIDTVVLGRRTLTAMEAMTVDAPEGEPPPTGPWRSYVFSKSLSAKTYLGMKVVRESPARFVNRIRKQPGKDIFLMGGGQLARSFLKADLIDELYIGWVPVLLGEGIPLFPAGFPQREFKLVECEKFSTDQFALRYPRLKPGSQATPRKS